MKKSVKVMMSLSFSDVFQTVKVKMNKLKNLFARNERCKIYNSLKLQVPENAILLQVD